VVLVDDSTGWHTLEIVSHEPKSSDRSGRKKTDRIGKSFQTQWIIKLIF